MRGEGLVTPADFGISVKDLTVLQRTQLALGEMRVGMWAMPGQDNELLSDHYARLAGRIGIEPAANERI